MRSVAEVRPQAGRVQLPKNYF